MPPSDFEHQEVQRTYAVVKSLSQFDQSEVRGILTSLIGDKTAEEICHLSCYFRAVANIESLLTLENVRDFQATAMLARSLFEIAVDLRLLTLFPDGAEKMIVFADVEKLRSARKVARFESEHPGSVPEVQLYRDAILAHADEIEAHAKRLWPETHIHKIRHWAQIDMDQRTQRLKSPFDQFYAVRYPQLSWFVHSGLTGVVNFHPKAYSLISGLALLLAAESYMLLLSDVIKVMHIGRTKEKIMTMMDLARMLPYTENQREAEKLAAAMLL